MILADLGATVVRIVGAEPAPIDAGRSRGAAPGTATSSSWPTDDATTMFARAPPMPTWRWSTGRRRWSRIAASATATLQAVNPALVYARCRPSRTAAAPSTTSACWSRPAPGSAPSWPVIGRADLRRRPRAGDRAPRSCSPPRCSRCCTAGPLTGQRRLGRDLALRRDARHARLHDRAVGAGGARRRGVLGVRARPSPTSCTAAPTAS